MVIRDLAAKKVLLHLLKNFSSVHTITPLAKGLSLSRVGVWKIIKQLESNKYIAIQSMGAGKTSTFVITLNWDNPLIEKMLSFYLTEEALEQRRWQVNFAQLEEVTSFVILYGSILHYSKEANDIDILGISSKNNFIKIQNSVDQIQKIQSKKIHSINFTGNEFKIELKHKNKAFLEAIQKGVILFGQDNFVKFMKGIKE